MLLIVETYRDTTLVLVERNVSVDDWVEVLTIVDVVLVVVVVEIVVLSSEVVVVLVEKVFVEVVVVVV
jgi:hypothetical protein